MLKKGDLFDNRYELLLFIGRGGFAEVWLVNDTLTGLEEALKIYAPGSGMDEDGLRIFVKELSVVHNLRHTNLLTPKILGQYERQPYLVLPYCPNGSLNKKVNTCSENEAWNILIQVASGLAYLHQRKIVHQDIKPDNILIDANMDYVITDFGISVKAQSTLRKSTNRLNSGTMAYMAPERFSAEPHPIPANDIWSLGAMMFELIEGDVPFLAQMGGLAQMNGAKIPTMHADVSNYLKQIIISMLALNVNERPTANQLADLTKKQGDGYQSEKKESVPSPHNSDDKSIPFLAGMAMPQAPSPHNSDDKSTRRLDEEKRVQVNNETIVADSEGNVAPPKKEPTASSDDKETKRMQPSNSEYQVSADSLPRFCRKCGTELSPAAKYCRRCGTQFD